jgi:hypothetical protein
VSAHPGADERRMRAILRSREVGPDAVPPAIPPKPTARPRDWLDEILTSAGPTPAPATPAPPAARPPEEEAEPDAEQDEPKKTKPKPKKRKRRNPHAPHSPLDSRPEDPRQSLVDAWDRIPYRLKWLGYHGSAAYLGWSCGLVDYASYVTAWIADTGLVGPQAVFWYVVGAATFLLHRRTRGWPLPIAWLAAVPATSVVVGVLLYAPTQ